MDTPEEMSPLWRLGHARERERVLVAIALGQTRWREVGEIIADAADASDARERVARDLGLDMVQATALLDMQFRRLSRLDRERIDEEMAAIRREIDELERAITDDPEQAGKAPAVPETDGSRRGWWGYEPRE